MSRNNFKILEEEEQGRYPGAPPQIESNIQNEMGILKMVGHIVDVYLPKVLELFIMITGGNTDRFNQQQTDYTDIDSSLDRRKNMDSILPPNKNIPPAGPSNPNKL
jgi:hypothetical protein